MRRASIGPCSAPLEFPSAPADNSLYWFSYSAFVAKARKSRRRQPIVVIKVSGSFSPLGLGDNTIFKAGLTTGNLTEDFFCTSTQLQIVQRALTAGEGQPSSVGVAHSDYTVGEILENLDNEFLGPGNKIAQEQSRRSVRTLGQLAPVGGQAGAETILTAKGKDGSTYMKAKCRFLISDGKTLDIWLWNRSGSALTTGSKLEWQGEIYGYWKV